MHCLFIAWSRKMSGPISQTASDGRNKILDLVDCSGSGDVDTSSIVHTEGSVEREIQGLTGRTLKVRARTDCDLSSVLLRHTVSVIVSQFCHQGIVCYMY